jgi:hypothetical protein
VFYDVGELHYCASDFLVLIHEFIELCVLVMNAVRRFLRHFTICLLENNNEARERFVQTVHTLDERRRMFELCGLRFQITDTLP